MVKEETIISMTNINPNEEKTDPETDGDTLREVRPQYSSKVEKIIESQYPVDEETVSAVQSYDESSVQSREEAAHINFENGNRTPNSTVAMKRRGSLKEISPNQLRSKGVTSMVSRSLNMMGSDA